MSHITNFAHPPQTKKILKVLLEILVRHIKKKNKISVPLLKIYLKPPVKLH